MLAAVRTTCTLLKVRIGIAIAASTLAGIAVTQGPAPSLLQSTALALAVLGASGAAGAFNHYFERDLDRLMKRTRSRPFASGQLQASRWWLVGFLALLLASLGLAAAAAGATAASFVFLGAFTYGIVYTVWLKRRSVWNIVIGGLSGSFAVMAGAAAVDPSPQAVPIIFSVVLFLWTPPHFWSLAAAKGEDYRSAGIPMLPITTPPRVWTAVILGHTVLLVGLSLVPLAYGMGAAYGTCAAVGGAVFIAKSIALWLRPGKDTAMSNFFASLLQLALLVTGAVVDAGLGPG